MATSRYIVVHDRTVKAAYYGFSEVGGASDEEWHGEQEEGGGGVELHGEVFCGEGGGGETSQVAKHLIDCQVHQVQLKKNKELHHLEDHVQPTVFFKLYLLKYGTNSHLQNIPIAACFILVKRWNWPAILRPQIMALQIENSIAIFSNKNKKTKSLQNKERLRKCAVTSSLSFSFEENMKVTVFDFLTCQENLLRTSRRKEAWSKQNTYIHMDATYIFVASKRTLREGGALALWTRRRIAEPVWLWDSFPEVRKEKRLRVV